MTETTTAEDPQATPLAVLLASPAALIGDAAALPELDVYRGVLTPRKLDTPTKEIAALASGAAVHDLGWLRRVAVRGEDRFRWLSGMVTNTVNDLAANGGAWNLVLNAQGRILGDLYTWREGESLEMEIAADQYERLLAHLDKFIIMDDVELLPLSLGPDGETALGLSGPQAGEVLERLGLPVLAEPLSNTCAQINGLKIKIMRGYGALTLHYELWVRATEIGALWKALLEAGACPVGSGSLEAFRIAEGIPAYGVDMVERDLPQETSQMRTLHFNKGCYQGQETVERIRVRGSVRRHLRQLELDSLKPEAGTELTFENASTGAISPAGQITSVAELPLPAATANANKNLPEEQSGPSSRIFALAMIRGEAEVGKRHLNYSVGATTGTARILAAPPRLELDQQS